MTEKPKSRTEQALAVLREAVTKLDGEMPGNRAIPLDLERILTFEDHEGTPRAVIQIRDVLCLASDLLRAAKIV